MIFKHNKQKKKKVSLAMSLFSKIGIGKSKTPDYSTLNKDLQSSLSIEDCKSSCEVSCDTETSPWPQFKDIDLDGSLYNTSKYQTVHFLIPTSKNNWKHDAINEEFEKESIPVELNFLLKNYSDIGSFGVNVVDKPIGDNIFDADIMKFKKLEKLYLLPFFITLNDVVLSELEDILEKIIPVLSNTEGINTRNQLIDKLNGLLDGMQCYVTPLLLNNLIILCSHKNRDKRCFITAGILKKEINKEIETYNASHQNVVDKSEVWFTNHIGGHKYQANMQIYLNFKNDEETEEDPNKEDGNLFIWLARIGVQHCKEIVADLLVKKGDTKEDRKLLLAEKVRCGKRYDW